VNLKAQIKLRGYRWNQRYRHACKAITILAHVGRYEPQKPRSGVLGGAPFLPDFCSTRIVLLAVTSPQLLAFIVAFSGVSGQALWINLALISLFIQGIAVGNIILLLEPRLAQVSQSAYGCA